MPHWIFSGIPSFTMIFQHHLARMDVRGVPLSIASSMNVQCVSLSNASSMDVQGVSFPPPAVQYGMQGVSLSIASSMNVWTCSVYPFPTPAVWTCRVYPFHRRQFSMACRVYLFPPPAVWTCRVYPFPQPAVWTCRVYPFPTPAVLTCRVYAFHHQQYSMTCSMYLFSPPAVRTCRVYPFLPQAVQYGKQGVSLSTASSTVRTCRVNLFPLSAVWTCRVYPSPSLCREYVFFFTFVNVLQMPECPTVRYLVSLIPEWTKMPMPKTVCYRNKGTRPGTGMLQYRTETSDAGMPIPAALPAKLRWSATLPNGFFCLPSKLRTRQKRFMFVVFL